MSEISQLYQKMLKFGETAKYRTFSPSELTKVLRRFVGTPDVKLKTHRDTHVDVGQVIIGGCYDPEEDQANFSSITIYVNFNPQQEEIYYSDIDWSQLSAELIECIAHEKVHQKQYRKRKFDIGPTVFASLSSDINKKLDQEYLGNPDEISAYGMSIAAEIHLKYNPSTLTQNRISRTAMYRAYKNAFGSNHLVTLQLVRFANIYFDQLISE